MSVRIGQSPREGGIGPLREFADNDLKWKLVSVRILLKQLFTKLKYFVQNNEIREISDGRGNGPTQFVSIQISNKSQSRQFQKIRSSIFESFIHIMKILHFGNCRWNRSTEKIRSHFSK